MTRSASSVSAAEKPKVWEYIKTNLRDYVLLIALIAIMIFFQFTTNGTLFMPVNLTNIILQNSYIIVMALGMLLVIIAGHIDLSVGSVSGFIGGVAALLLTGTMPFFKDEQPALQARYVLHGRHLHRAGCGHWCGPGLFCRLLQNPGLHHHAGWHVDLPRT